MRYFDLTARTRAINVERDFTTGSDLIEAEPSLFIHAIYNLLRNAANALANIDSPKIVVRTINDDRGFLIEVEDNGPGVSPEIHSRLFSDFCTTSPNGTGLGLFTCRGSLALMNASIEYVTKIGQPFARFRIISTPAGAGASGGRGVHAG
jgi:signal transduction histidine kinase